ncbi:MAG TPA: hypothetical protein DEA55_07005 [Rhodospirillaceae bacterium]|nr:hypothetical protein [Rhodospirillaceae bacterium]
MDRAYDTLFYAIESGSLAPPGAGQSVLFVNAAPCAGIDFLASSKLTLQQHFKPYVDALTAQGYEASADLPETQGVFDYVFIAAPKSKQETQYLLARGMKLLRPGGMIICAAANDAGGRQLAGFFEALGLKDIGQESKYKGRVVWGQVPQNPDEGKIAEWITAGSPQSILGGRFVSVPGLFAWDKIDKGSEILTRHMPENLKGAGADFCCGYGYLASHLLQHNPAIERLVCIDADARAVAVCKENLAQIIHPAKKEFLWADLTKPLSGIGGFDWIVMNPPFHEGKAGDVSIGQACIQTAAKTLRPGGKLWMVSNAMLAYETVLKSTFKRFNKEFEGQGYKVFVAEK